MRKIILLTFVFLHLTTYAQVVSSRSNLDFGEVTADGLGNTTKSLDLEIENKNQGSINLQFISHNTAFSVDTKSLTIESGKKAIVKVTFDPETNLRYNSELVIRTHELQGDLSVDIRGDGRFEDTYYSSTFDLSQEDLKAELKRIVSKNTVSLGYNSARDAMYATIDNVGGKMTCVYTGRTANFTTRSGANSNNFNCEHTWPQSLFSSREPEKSDIHHLFPTYAPANSQRGNLPFGNVTNPTYEDGGSKKGNGNFEVRDDHKGNTARAMMYFSTRYGNVSGFLTNQESTLRQWHKLDKPDAKEIARNEAIFSRQKNRNPFVDHPEFLNRIQSLSTTSTAPTIKKYAVSSDSFVQHSLKGVGDILHVPVINTGNVKLDFESPSIQGDYRLKSDMAFSIEPGEAHVLELEIAVLDKPWLMAELNLKADGVSRTVPISLKTLDVGFQEKNDAITLNYFDGILRISQQTSLGPSHLEILSMDGSQIHFSDISGSLTEFDTQVLPSGVYIALVESKGYHKSLRFIVP